MPQLVNQPEESSDDQGGTGESAHKKMRSGQVWWYTPLVPAVGKQRQGDLFECKASQSYTVKTLTQKETTEFGLANRLSSLRSEVSN